MFHLFTRNDKDIVFLLLEDALDSIQSFIYLFLLCAEGDTNVSLAVGSENEAWRDKYSCLIEHFLCQFLTGRVRVRYSSPEEHSHLLRVECAAEHVHYLLCNIAATTVTHHVGFMMPLGSTVVQSFCGCEL